MFLSEINNRPFKSNNWIEKLEFDDGSASMFTNPKVGFGKTLKECSLGMSSSNFSVVVIKSMLAKRSSFSDIFCVEMYLCVRLPAESYSKKTSIVVGGEARQTKIAAIKSKHPVKPFMRTVF